MVAIVVLLMLLGAFYLLFFTVQGDSREAFVTLIATHACGCHYAARVSPCGF